MVYIHPGGWKLLRRKLQEAAGAGQELDARTAKSAKPFSKMSHIGVKRYDSVALTLFALGMKC